MLFDVCKKLMVYTSSFYNNSRVDIPVSIFFHFSRVTFKDVVNQSVLGCLVREVKTLNPVFLTHHIKGKIYSR